MTRKIILVNLIIITTILLAACGSPAAGPAPVANGPTVDPNLVFTSGAQTVVAQITLDAASRPIPTIAAPPTQKPLEALPTLPLAGGALPPLASAETPGAPAGAVVTQGIAVPTLVSMATLAPAAPAVTAGASIPDRLTWVSNVPADKSKLPAGKKFKITWKLSNSGTTTWTDTYTFRHYAGTQLAVNGAYPVVKDVLPGKSMDFTVDCVAPTTPGDYYSLWTLQRPDGTNIGRFDITLTVQ